jgi:16S rRNA (guanine527-N7)-methyltransferase
MTEDDARAWIRASFGVPRETILERYVDLLRAEAARQNLVSASTLEHVWARHIVDSAQLLFLADAKGSWIDIGSGAGLPGLVITAVSDRPIVLVEPRAKRAEFLRHAIGQLGLGDRAEVVAKRIEAYRSAPAAVISARAVAELGALLASAAHCADSSTVWLLPKGRNAQSEVEAARRAWQGVFHVEPSITQPDSGIVVARKVRPR